MEPGPERTPPPSEAASELAELATGLRAEVRRRRARGLWRIRVRAPAPGAGAAGAEVARPAAPAAPAEGRRSDWLIPQAPPPRRDPAAEPTQRASRSPALAAAESRASAVRERAQECEDLDALRLAVAGCTACGLCQTRTQTVFSDGNGGARVMFVGEAPGADEDASGVPFVGRAGKLLTDIVTRGMGLRREDVYIANVLKCRPPSNRDPSPAEKLTCTPWLDRQVELLDPAVIVPLGRHAANHVLGLDQPMGRLRGQVHVRGERRIVPTFHPAYLLRSPGMKKECWQDIQRAMEILGLERPS